MTTDRRRTQEVADLAGVTYAKAHQWVTRGLIPGQASTDPVGSGNYRWWDTNDTNCALLVARLITVVPPDSDPLLQECTRLAIQHAWRGWLIIEGSKVSHWSDPLYDPFPPLFAAVHLPTITEY